MEERVKWLDGIKGYACIIVLLGHSVACIFPNVFFGDSYASHGIAEQIIHKTPLMLFFNSAKMVGLFFVAGGYTISRIGTQRNIIKMGISKYLRYLPMMIIGAGLGWFVMRIGMVYSIKLAEYSYAGQYVNEYNNFEPSILGMRGLLVDAFIKVFLKHSKYNNTLWFISAYFWGTVITEFIHRIIKAKWMKILILSVVFIVFINLDFIDWKLPYLSYIFLGYLIGNIRTEGIKIKSYLCIILFAVGLFITSASGDRAGIYSVLSSHVFGNHYVYSISAALVILAVSMSDKLQPLFCNRISEALAKFSFGIYVTQWPIIISVSCGITYYCVINGIPYLIGGILGIVMGSLVTISLSYIYTRYVYKPYCRIIKEHI